MEQKAFLVLENGAVFEGTAFGAPVGTTGEVVFTTAMTGYLETLTDPSYYGQIVVQTFPLIGNYGIIPEDFESSTPRLRGYIVSEWCHAPSNFRAEGKLDTFLKDCGIPGLYGVDTRALTKMTRERGVMNGKIVYSADEIPKAVAEASAYRVTEAVENAGENRRREYAEGDAKRHVVLWDFGAKQNLVREMTRRGFRVTCVPYDTKAAEILELSPDGILLSNGPGDPKENRGVIAELAKLCEAKKPMFGVCLGHQLMALARGADTEKLRYGHRGANQPVRDEVTGRLYITSQNHGYMVKNDTLPAGSRVRFVNANDGTCEGVEYTDMPAFTVQFHPEGCGGPQDTGYLFDRFAEMMEGK